MRLLKSIVRAIWVAGLVVSLLYVTSGNAQAGPLQKIKQKAQERRDERKANRAEVKSDNKSVGYIRPSYTPIAASSYNTKSVGSCSNGKCSVK